MPRSSSNVPQSGAAAQFVLFTTPIPLSCLEPSSLSCAICREPYGEYTPTSVDLEDGRAEWAVRVDISAAHDGGTRCCGHIFGRRCLEKHLRTAGAWHNKCPICRAVWFSYARSDTNQSTSTATTQTTSALLNATATVSPRVPWLSRSTLRRRHRNGGIGRVSSGLSNRGRLQRASGFIQHVLDAFEVEEGSDEVKASVEQVEVTLEQLYRNLEEQEQDQR
ncbi:hypothetical protein BDV95DRAFT_481577 [Massariosphaeria phaeospora]|uniref:RING-type domain-containing protein n=1 Tax=Massariosphaeria phaeospora TaxID=100035 RepID=A0A7C8MHT6_9PLEO|nr:hypothetical protein BDV95DRAFT_481577 [Massariosphaeria phaeospora]